MYVKAGTVVAIRAGNRRKDRKYYRYDIVCDRGYRKHNSEWTGRRNVTSMKEECPYTGRAVALASRNDRWAYETTHPTHNHSPSLDSFVQPAYRRRTDDEMAAIERYA